MYETLNEMKQFKSVDFSCFNLHHLERFKIHLPLPETFNFTR